MAGEMPGRPAARSSEKECRRRDLPLGSGSQQSGQSVGPSQETAANCGSCNDPSLIIPSRVDEAEEKGHCDL